MFLTLLVAIKNRVYASGHHTVGLTLVFAGVGSMLAAALVLLPSSRAHRSAAVKQGALPLLAVATLAYALI